MSLTSGVHPCFELADAARQAVCDGQLHLALSLFQAAHDAWRDDEAPLDENDRPELFWPYVWEGSMLTLSALPAERFLDVPQLASLENSLLDSLLDRA